MSLLQRILDSKKDTPDLIHDASFTGARIYAKNLTDAIVSIQELTALLDAPLVRHHRDHTIHMCLLADWHSQDAKLNIIFSRSEHGKPLCAWFEGPEISPIEGED